MLLSEQGKDFVKSNPTGFGKCSLHQVCRPDLKSVALLLDAGDGQADEIGVPDPVMSTPSPAVSLLTTSPRRGRESRPGRRTYTPFQTSSSWLSHMWRIAGSCACFGSSVSRSRRPCLISMYSTKSNTSCANASGSFCAFLRNSLGRRHRFLRFKAPGKFK